MLIGKLASSSGFSRDTIRYYEKLGLLTLEKEARWDNNYKDYPPQEVERLRQIGQLKELGFTLREIKDLFEALSTQPQPCANLPEQLDQKLDLLQHKIALLEDYKAKLLTVRRACNTECGASDGLPTCFVPEKC